MQISVYFVYIILIHTSNGSMKIIEHHVFLSFQADYMSSVYTNVFRGLIVRVHNPELKPNMRSTGSVVPVGFHTNMAISQNEVMDYPGIHANPWLNNGDCVYHWRIWRILCIQCILCIRRIWHIWCIWCIPL